MAETTSSARRQMPECGYEPQPYQGPSREDVLRTRLKFGNPGIFTFYRDPLMLVEGYRQYLYDETGRRYLDMFAGIATVSCGHSHPQVVAAIEKQLKKLGHTSTIYLHPNFGELARKLASKMPAGLEVTYFTNSGSEANELAVNLARLYTGRSDVISIRNGYHGGSSAAMGLTSLHTWKFPIPQGVSIHHTVCPDPYRSLFEGTPEQIAELSALEMEDLIRFSTPGEIAAFIAEPIQGVGGATHGAPNYLLRTYQIARAYGGLCISDEVQTGFGRTGAHYWGFENSGVIPDIVTTAKAFGNGMPLGAVTTRREIAEVLTQRAHFNTFGGNPLSMAAGLAVLDVIDEENLQGNAVRVGGHLKEGLAKLMEAHTLIGDIRGRGFMLGIELVRDRQTKDPAREETLQVLETCRELGVLAGKGGLFGNVLRVKPPLCITREDADFFVDVLDEALGRVGSS